jgi:hypothetical protein
MRIAHSAFIVSAAFFVLCRRLDAVRRRQTAAVSIHSSVSVLLRLSASKSQKVKK